MQDQIKYTKSEIIETINSLSRIFDIVRLVEPISAVSYKLENNEFTAQPYRCYHVWNKNSRCDNCISMKCFINKHRCSKFEFINESTYHVVAQDVIVDGIEYILEIVAVLNDDVLLSAFGNNEFVQQITKYNTKIYKDPLTELLNRRYIDERYPIMVNHAFSEKLSLSTVMLDVDDFKLYNDTFGHQKGDEILQFIASTLQANFSTARGDIVARYGGDEFFLAIPGMSKNAITERLDKVQSIISESEYNVTISAGIYYQQVVDNQDCPSMIKKADDALYSIKRTRKGHACFVE